MAAKRTWISEHGKHFEVPAEILNLADAEDLSWHNDLCPCFGKLTEARDDTVACIWIDHPDPAKRENIDEKRFMVQHGDKVDEKNWFATDDVNEAIAKYREFIK